jgi:2-phospho-L-lactate guanylyltransferase
MLQRGADVGDDGRVDLVVPVKPLHAAKSRLRGAADRGVGDPDAHAALALALAHDTVAAVLGARAVRRLLVISSDPVVAAELAAVGVEVVPDVTDGLNAALDHGAALLQAADPASAVGALQADLPALRPGELDAALHDAAALFAAGTRRAFCPDAQGTGTTLLLVAPGTGLDPRFGAGSAAHHRASGAVPLLAAGPGLRRDVDTGDDLCAAAELGLGPHTRAVLAPTGRC